MKNYLDGGEAILEAFRLGVVLTLRRSGVDASLARHPHQVVRACAVAADEDEDRVRERGERLA